MSEFGSNLAAESVDLFRAFETKTYSVIEAKNLAIEQFLCQMEDLEEFLTIIAQGSDAFDAGDKTHLADFAHKKELIGRLCKNPDLHHIFPPTKFSWVDEEIPAVAKQIKGQLEEWQNDDNMKRMIHQRIEGFLQREINRKSEEIMFDQQDLSKTADLFNRGLHRMCGLIDAIMRNIQRVH